MINTNLLVVVAITYVAVLFAVAAIADRQVARGQFGWLKSPLVYTLSLSVYCTAWTFYGAVGSAVRNGLEFAAIYLGPTLLFVGWFWILRKLVRIGRTQRITSIADLISSRYGKSNTMAALVTLLAVISSTPYIALQLQSLTISFSTLSAGTSAATQTATAFWIAAGLAVFTILFGTRNVDANERHHGVVTAIAFEAIVKLVALLAVGIFVVFWLADGPSDIFARAPENMLEISTVSGPRWIAITSLAAMAIITLPRMFHVMVVENVDERHLATAAWAFPLYIFLISLFVIPIAIAGLSTLPEGANPDMFVLTVPLAAEQTGLALLAFLGGFSAATSMVIVSSIALATMVSNHIVVPLWLRYFKSGPESSGDVRGILLTSRRFAIGAVLALGFFYFQVTGGTGALASIGLIAFTGMAQLVPALLGGIFWRGATRQGAITGLVIGALIWAYCLFLPSFEGKFLLSAATIAEGPFGIAALRPEALFGLTGMDRLVHALFWSLALNTIFFVGISLISQPSELERLQTALFVDAYRQGENERPLALGRSATSEDLFTLGQRILGADAAYRLFADAARAQGKPSGLPEPTQDFIASLERQLSGSVGSASAHAMITQIAGGGSVSVDELIEIADETAQILQYSQRLEAQSKELEDTASKLRAANLKLTELGAQKDAFLSQVSHELRTPMTSIRSFTEILRGVQDIEGSEAQRFLSIIGAESERLTRLLDEILDLSFLESGQMKLERSAVKLSDVIDRALQSGTSPDIDLPLGVARDGEAHDAMVLAEPDRLHQVFINLITNAIKYGDPVRPMITVSAYRDGGRVIVDVADNGPGIPVEAGVRVFEKFTRLDPSSKSGSAGLGLPISREIMRNLGGDLTLVPSQSGAMFRVTLDAA
jgi:Na+/proline symporter/nitrogen-specific signal transduction histidine kinase